MKTILIVGATSAIAEHYARLEAAAGGALLLVGRAEARLHALPTICTCAVQTMLLYL